MKVFMKKVENTIGRDGLNYGVYVFEKVIDHLKTLEDIKEEEYDEVVSSISNKKTTSKFILYYVLHSIITKLKNSSDSDTKAISYRQNKIYCLKVRLNRKWPKAVKSCFTVKCGQYFLY